MSTQVTIVDADLAALVNEMRATLRKIDAVADAVLAAIPVIQSKAAQAADAMTSAQAALTQPSETFARTRLTSRQKW